MLSISLLLLPLFVNAELLQYDWYFAAGIANPDCIDKAVILVNGAYDAPEVRAKIGDTVEVTVRNGLPDQELYIHWHGIYHDDPYMDGHRDAHCSISTGSHFTYRFTILESQSPGSYMWHVHSGLRTAGGASNGIFIVDPKEGETEPYADEYTDELLITIEDNFMLSNTEMYAWTISPPFGTPNLVETILLNGKMEVDCSLETGPKGNFRFFAGCDCAKSAGLSELTVTQGTTYRLRLFSFGHASSVSFTINGHTMTVIESDGRPIEKYETTHLYLQPGQRYSVLITFDQPIENYWMSVLGDLPAMPWGQPGQAHGYGIIRYDGADTSARPDESGLTNGVEGDSIHPAIVGGALQQQANLKKLTTEEEKSPSLSDVTKFIDLHSSLGIGVYDLETAMFDSWLGGDRSNLPAGSYTQHRYLFGENGEETYVSDPDPFIFKSVFGGVTAESDSNPLRFHVNVGDVVQVQFTEYAIDFPGPGSGSCIKHSYHLHGDGYWLVHYSEEAGVPETEADYSYDYNEVAKRDAAASWPNPIKYLGESFFGSDTVSVPMRQYPCGTIIFRFRVRFPGVWPFHCHHTAHPGFGLQVLLVTDNIPQPSLELPVCGATSVDLRQQKNRCDADLAAASLSEPEAVVEESDGDDVEKIYKTLTFVFIGLSAVLATLCGYFYVQLNSRRSRKIMGTGATKTGAASEGGKPEPSSAVFE